MRETYVYHGDIYKINSTTYDEFRSITYKRGVTIITQAASRIHAINNILYKINMEHTGHGNYRIYYIESSKVKLYEPEPIIGPDIALNIKAEVIKPKPEYEQMKLFDGGHLGFYANKH